jgi:hypothetical protein
MEQSAPGLYVKSRNGLRFLDRKVQRLVREMHVVIPLLEQSDTPMARAWAQFEVLADTVYVALMKTGILTVAGESRRLLDDYRKLRPTKVLPWRELGMSPASRMALRASGTRPKFDLVAAMAQAQVEERSDTPRYSALAVSSKTANGFEIVALASGK